eukprot:scaffold608_cov248-Pinguiococcus_pyrenoidosus.AAC.6
MRIGRLVERTSSWRTRVVNETVARHERPSARARERVRRGRSGVVSTRFFLRFGGRNPPSGSDSVQGSSHVTDQSSRAAAASSLATTHHPPPSLAFRILPSVLFRWYLKILLWNSNHSAFEYLPEWVSLVPRVPYPSILWAF